ncbi:MAG TPA: MarR family transcriptional regulator [Nitrososphaerales archaeon]|nr:MarR family transcriptional regulator [Nitrososphaerales archaeon]
MLSLQNVQKQKAGVTSEDPIENVAWRCFADTYKMVYSYIMSDLRQYGLTPPQYTVLRIIGISRYKQLTMSEIGKEMTVTFANITTIVDNLEKLQYVQRQRDPRDRRLVKVELTEAGTKLYKKINRSHRKEVAKLMKVLDEAQLKQLIEFTEAIRKNTSLVVLGAKSDQKS